MADRIIAVGLLTQRDLNLLGVGFSRAYPVDQTPCFSELLRAIDEADRELWIERDRSSPAVVQKRSEMVVPRLSPDGGRPPAR